MRAPLLCRPDNLIRRQANALIGNIHTAIASAKGNLFGPVGMAIQPRLAHQKFQPTPQLIAHRIHRAANILQPFGLIRRAARHPCRPAIFAVNPPHLSRPFASGHASLGRRNRRGHDVPPGLGRLAQRA